MKTIELITVLIQLALFLCTNLVNGQITLGGQKNLPSAGLKHLVVGNLSGEIRLTGGDKSEVSVSWSGRVEPEHKQNYQAEDFKVYVNASSDTVWVYLETPCGNFKPTIGHKAKFFDWKNCDLDADIEVNYTITVPRHMTVYASNMNEGDIILDGLNNQATLKHLNGNIQVTNQQGKVDLTTLNGNVACAFKSVNAEPCTFNTLNGSIKIQVPSSFSAQVKFKSLHGDLFTNIDDTKISYQTETTQTKDKNSDGIKIKIGSNQLIKFGSGAGQWTTETLNGNVYIRSGE